MCALSQKPYHLKLPSLAVLACGVEMSGLMNSVEHVEALPPLPALEMFGPVENDKSGNGEQPEQAEDNVRRRGTKKSQECDDEEKKKDVGRKRAKRPRQRVTKKPAAAMRNDEGIDEDEDE